MKIAIVGFGSIGRKHYDNFLNLGCHVAVISRRASIGVAEVYADIAHCEDRFAPDLYFVCSRTAEHHQSIAEIKKINSSVRIIVEKPLSHSVPDAVETEGWQSTRVSYNLRFNPLLQQLKKALITDPPISAVAYVGQYLPQWRPGSDYSQSYSASLASGGGVLLDLSHELDYLFWLTGPATGVLCLGGQLSGLQITSEDTAHISYLTQTGIPVSVQLNYLDRAKNRFLILNTRRHTYKLNLVTNEYQKDDTVTVFDGAMMQSYIGMAQNIMHEEARGLTTFSEAMETLKFIDACRHSMARREWVSL